MRGQESYLASGGGQSQALQWSGLAAHRHKALGKVEVGRVFCQAPPGGAELLLGSPITSRIRENFLVMMPRHWGGSEDLGGGRTLKVTPKVPGHCHVSAAHRKECLGCMLAHQAFLSHACFFPWHSRAWLARGEGGCWDERCAYGWDGLYRETGKGSFPGPTPYQVVRYCRLGPRGASQDKSYRAGKERMWKCHAQKCACQCNAKSPSPRVGKGTCPHDPWKTKKMQLSGASALYCRKTETREPSLQAGSVWNTGPNVFTGQAILSHLCLFKSFITNSLLSPSALDHKVKLGHAASPPASWGPWSDQRSDADITLQPPLNFWLQTHLVSSCRPVATQPHMSNKMVHSDQGFRYLRVLTELSFYCGIWGSSSLLHQWTE